VPQIVLYRKRSYKKKVRGFNMLSSTVKTKIWGGGKRQQGGGKRKRQEKRKFEPQEKKASAAKWQF